MIIDNLHGLGPSVGPAETDAELVVDANGIFSAAVAFQGLKPIAGRHAQCIESGCGVELVKFSSGDVPQFARASTTPSFRIAAVENVLRARIGE